jgi:tetratricopeptide (TPR) repeat protein
MLRTTFARVAMLTAAMSLAFASSAEAQHRRHRSKRAKDAAAAESQVAAAEPAPAVPASAPAAAPAPAAAAAAEGPSADTRERARSAYREGQKLFSSAKYEDAALAFEAAFNAIPNPVVLLSVAESRAKAGQTPEAIAAFKKYLTLRPDAPDRATVEGRIASLGAKAAFVSVTSEPADADVELDGSPMFRTPVQLELKPGAHELRCTRPGYRAQIYTITAEPGSRQALQCQLDVLPPTPHVAALEDEQRFTKIPRGRPMTAIWITGGVGAAALVNSAVFGALAISANADFKKHPTTASADRGERFALVADIGFGAGVVLVATAATLYLLSDGEACADAASLGQPVVRF